MHNVKYIMKCMILSAPANSLIRLISIGFGSREMYAISAMTKIDVIHGGITLIACANFILY